MQISLEHVNCVKKRLKDKATKVYYYHRLTGKRILGEPGTLEFVRSYEQAAVPTDTDKGGEEGKFSSLLKTYQASPEFRKLADSTRANYRQRIGVLAEAFGELELRAFSNRKIRATVLRWRDEIALDK